MGVWALSRICKKRTGQESPGRNEEEGHIGGCGSAEMRWSGVLMFFVTLLSAGAAWPLPASDRLSPDRNMLLRKLIDSGDLPDLRWPNWNESRSDVAKFYQSTGDAPAWVRSGTATPQALALIRVLQGAWAKGLDPEDYDGSRWTARLARLRPACAQPSDQDLIHFDLALTISAMRYVSDLRVGKVNPKVFCFGLNVDEKRCED